MIGSLPASMNPLIQRLLDESQALRHEDPQAMLALARQAVRVASRLPDDQARERCEAWAHYANALRVCNRFREARAAFRLAWAAFEGVGDQLLAARIYELEASLLESTRKFREADLNLEKALNIRLSHDDEDGHTIGACLIQRANVAGHSGDFAAAIRHLRSALDFPARDQVTVIAVVHNLAWFLVDAGEPDLALTVVLEHLAAAPVVEDRLVLLRSRWLNARIIAALEKDFPAIAQIELSEVRDEFLTLGLPFDAALAGLELLSHQATPEPSSLVALQQIFEALGVEREALASRLLLDAVQGERLDIPRVVEALKALRAMGKLKLVRRP